mgnify:CR=1 FL=1
MGAGGRRDVHPCRGRACPALYFPANARYRETRLLGPLWEGTPAAAGGGRELRGYPKYFGQWQGSLPPALRGHLPRRGRQEVTSPQTPGTGKTAFLAPSGRGLPPQRVGERASRLPEIFRAMARFSPSGPAGPPPSQREARGEVLPRKRTAPGNPRAGHVRPLLHISHF